DAATGALLDSAAAPALAPSAAGVSAFCFGQPTRATSATKSNFRIPASPRSWRRGRDRPTIVRPTASLWAARTLAVRMRCVGDEVRGRVLQVDFLRRPQTGGTLVRCN